MKSLKFLLQFSLRSFRSVWERFWAFVFIDLERVLAINYFHKKLHRRCLTGSLLLLHIMNASSHPEVFCQKGALKNFAKFSGKHLRQSLFYKEVYVTSMDLKSFIFLSIPVKTFLPEKSLTTKFEMKNVVLSFIFRKDFILTD